jgi:hypothetical protein
VGPVLLPFQEKVNDGEDIQHSITGPVYNVTYVTKPWNTVASTSHKAIASNKCFAEHPAGKWNCRVIDANPSMGYDHDGKVLMLQTKFKIKNKRKYNGLHNTFKKFQNATLLRIMLNAHKQGSNWSASNYAYNDWGSFVQLVNEPGKNKSHCFRVRHIRRPEVTELEYVNFCKARSINFQGSSHQDGMLMYEHKDYFYVAVRIGADWLKSADGNYIEVTDKFTMWSADAELPQTITLNLKAAEDEDISANAEYWAAINKDREPENVMWHHNAEHYEMLTHACAMRAKNESDWKYTAAIKLNQQQWKPYENLNAEEQQIWDQNKTAVTGFYDDSPDADNFVVDTDGPDDYDEAVIVPNVAKVKTLEQYKKLLTEIETEVKAKVPNVSKVSVKKKPNPLSRPTRHSKENFYATAGNRSIIATIIGVFTTLATIIGEASSKRSRRSKLALPSVNTSKVPGKIPFSFKDQFFVDCGIEEAESYPEALMSLDDFETEAAIWYPDWFRGLNRSETFILMEHTRGPIYARIANCLEWAKLDSNGKMTFVPYHKKVIEHSPFREMRDEHLRLLGDHQVAYETIKNSHNYLFFELAKRVCPEIFDDQIYRISESKFKFRAEAEYNAALDLNLIDAVTARAMWIKLTALFYARIDNTEHTFAEKYEWYLTNDVNPMDFLDNFKF